MYGPHAEGIFSTDNYLIRMVRNGKVQHHYTAHGLSSLALHIGGIGYPTASSVSICNTACCVQRRTTSGGV